LNGRLSGIRRKTINSFTIHKDSIDGPEICIEFSDGTVFSSRLKTSTALEGKVARNEGGDPRLLKDYSTLPVSR
jgi:hypothetical protein